MTRMIHAAAARTQCATRVFYSVKEALVLTDSFFFLLFLCVFLFVSSIRVSPTIPPLFASWILIFVQRYN